MPKSQILPTAPPPKQRIGRKTTEEHAERVKLLANWYATPEQFRTEKTLNALAVKNGNIPNHNWYRLAHSDEVYHQTMLVIAGKALERAPAILDKLADDALGDGRSSVRAAEVFLEFNRKVITDSNLLARVAPNTDSVTDIMDKLDNCLEAINLKASDYLNHRHVEAAEWSEVDEKHMDGPEPRATERSQEAGAPPKEADDDHRAGDQNAVGDGAQTTRTE